MYAQLLTKSSTGVCECIYSVLELSDQVFLIAPVIGREHDLFGRVSRSLVI